MTMESQLSPHMLILPIARYLSTWVTLRVIVMQAAHREFVGIEIEGELPVRKAELF